MARLIDEIADFLEAQGVCGGATGWDLKTDRWPADGDKVVAVLPAPGRPPGTRIQADYPSFQIRVRAPAFEAALAEERLRAAFDKLHGWPGGVIGATYYAYIMAEGDVLPLGPDQSNRPVMAQQFRTMRSR